ncbi:MAG: tetratricopeptide repeat protein [Muribaculaceae bacterium]|nr:tetratricopeptide repeat protein [Muribaculaceae bacterium]
MGKDNIINFSRISRKKEAKSSVKRGFALFNEGMCFYNENKYEIALKKFEESESAGYESAEMFTNMTWLYGHFGNNEKVKSYAFKALELDDEYEHAYCLLGVHYFEQEKDMELALKYSLLAEKYGCDFPSSYRIISEIYMDSGDFVSALNYATKAIFIEPNDSYSYYWKGFVYYHFLDYKKGLAYFLKAEKMGERFVDLYDAITHCYSLLKDYDKALEYANKIIFLDRNNYLGYYRRGIIYYYTEDNDRALEQFLLAHKCGSRTLDLHLKISYLYVNFKNDAKEALNWILNGYKLNSGDIEADYYSFLISLLFENHRYKKGHLFVEEALSKFPDDYNLWLLKIAAAQTKKMYREIEKCVKKLKALQPDNPWSIFYQAVVCSNKPKGEVNYNKIILLLSKIQAEDEIFLSGAQLLGLGEAYYQTNRYEKCINCYAEFFANPSYVEVLDNFEIKGVMKLLKKLYKKFPNDVRLLEIVDRYPELF